MENAICQITFILLLWHENARGISSGDLYPFGPSYGDKRAPTNDDGFTDSVPISSLFPFFNNQHDSLIVNTNGVISFLGTMSTYTPSPFPLGSNRRIVAPYWTDVDTTNGGDIWYRESTDYSLLQNASNEITKFFPEQYRFQASWMFIATWYNVAFYGANNIGVNKCVLITNGRHSFAMFLYEKIEWTTGTASGGSSSTGLGGIPAQVGFDAGDGINFKAIEASRTPDIINVPLMSNVGIPGKFIFRVDSAEITQGGCNTNGTLTITPAEVSMFGGTLLVISGPCFNQSESASFVMSNTAEGPCKLVSESSVSCIAPAVYRTGRELVSLNMIQNDAVFIFTGVITVVNHALTKISITRYPTFWSHGSIVSISWNSVFLHFPINDEIEIDLFYPQTKSNSSETELQHYLSLPPPNSTDIEIGTYSFVLNFTKPAGIVRVSANSPASPYYWSDMFTVYVNISLSIGICDEWNKKEQSILAVDVNGIIPCPCTLEVAILDVNRFHKDPLCQGHECLYQPFAKICFQQNLPTSQGHGSQCCYGSNGALMNHQEYFGSGYTHRFHYTGGSSANDPFLSNFVYDIIPYQHCCVYQIQDIVSVDYNIYSSCALFYRRRPPNSCLNYRPPIVARVSGDPHFATFDGLLYTLNAIGEFLAIANNDFILQIRLEQFGSSRGSSVTAFAVKPYDTADIVEVQTNAIRGIDVLVNRELVEFDTLISNSLYNRGSKVEKISGDQLSVTVTFDGQGIAVKAFSVLNILNLLVMVSPDKRGDNFVGLLGNNDGTKDNDLISRTGEIIPSNSSRADIHNRFGISWNIYENETLFKYPNGRQYSSYQNPAFNPVVVIPDNISTIITDVCGTNEECIYDYYVTGNQNLGQISANSSQQFDIIYNITAEVASCGFPYTVNNAVWQADGYTEGYQASLECNAGYYPSHIVTTCLSSANWGVINASCIPLPDCGLPPFVLHGEWESNEESNGNNASLKCNNGYYMNTVVQIACDSNASWTHYDAFCMKECKNPDPVDNGIWLVDGYRNGSKAELYCNPGYNSVFHVVLFCDENGRWNENNEACILESTVPTTNESTLIPTVHMATQTESTVISMTESSTTESNFHTSTELITATQLMSASMTTMQTMNETAELTHTQTFTTEATTNVPTTNVSITTTANIIELTTYIMTTPELINGPTPPESLTTLTTKSKTTESITTTPTTMESTTEVPTTTESTTTTHTTTESTTNVYTTKELATITTTKESTTNVQSTTESTTTTLSTAEETTNIQSMTESTTKTTTITEPTTYGSPISGSTNRTLTTIQSTTNAPSMTESTKRTLTTELTTNHPSTHESNISTSSMAEETSNVLSMTESTARTPTTTESTTIVTSITILTTRTPTNTESTTNAPSMSESTTRALTTTESTTNAPSMSESTIRALTTTESTTNVPSMTESTTRTLTTKESTTTESTSTIIPTTTETTTINLTNIVSTTKVPTMVESTATTSTTTESTTYVLITTEPTTEIHTTTESPTKLITTPESTTAIFTTSKSTTIIQTTTEATTTTTEERTNVPITNISSMLTTTTKESTNKIPITTQLMTTEHRNSTNNVPKTAESFTTTSISTKSTNNTQTMTQSKIITGITEPTANVPTTTESNTTTVSSTELTTKQQPMLDFKTPFISESTTQSLKTTVLGISTKEIKTTNPITSESTIKTSATTESKALIQTSPTTVKIFTTESKTANHNKTDSSLPSNIFESTTTNTLMAIQTRESVHSTQTKTGRFSSTPSTEKSATANMNAIISTSSETISVTQKIIDTTTAQTPIKPTTTEIPPLTITTSESKTVTSTTIKLLTSSSTSRTTDQLTNTADLKNANKANNDDPAFKAIISIVSVVIGIAFTASVVAIIIKCRKLDRKKATRGLHRSDNDETYTEYGNMPAPQWTGFFKQNGPIMYKGQWTSYSPKSFPSFENLSNLQSGRTDLDERIDNYRV